MQLAGCRKQGAVPICPFAPYFRSDELRKFAKLHKVFGASNVSKIFNKVLQDQRQERANALVYEAEFRLKDPIHGCVGAIASLHKKMTELQNDLIHARARLAQCSNESPAINSLFVDHHFMHSLNEIPGFDGLDYQNCTASSIAQVGYEDL